MQIRSTQADHACLQRADLSEIVAALSAPLNGSSAAAPTRNFAATARQMAERPISPALTNQQDKRVSRKAAPAVTPSVIRSVPITSPDRQHLPAGPSPDLPASSSRGIPAAFLQPQPTSSSISMTPSLQAIVRDQDKATGATRRRGRLCSRLRSRLTDTRWSD